MQHKLVWICLEHILRSDTQSSCGGHRASRHRGTGRIRVRWLVGLEHVGNLGPKRGLFFFSCMTFFMIATMDT